LADRVVTLSVLCQAAPCCAASDKTENHGVGGSIPPLGTMIFKGLGDLRD